jgi:uncharacterized protein
MEHKESVIEKTAEFVKEKLGGEGTGHDWWHAHRVLMNAILIGEKEDVDMYVVRLAALLHDIADWKFCDEGSCTGPEVARDWLEKLQVEEETIAHVCEIIDDLSFKGAKVKTPMKTREGMVVQDADRLDALGAIGIARTFAYGGSKGRELYNPEIEPEEHSTFEQYKSSTSPTINHFYEKLLLLKDLMNTDTAKRIAKDRHEFMEEYLKMFFDEWNGKR